MIRTVGSNPPMFPMREVVEQLRAACAQRSPADSAREFGAHVMLNTFHRSLACQSVALLCAALTLVGCGKDRSTAQTAIAAGQVEQQTGQHSQAIQSFTDAMLVDPDNAEAYHLRAISYLTVNNEKSAINDLHKAIKLKPDWADPWHTRGLLHRKQGRNVTAIKDFTTAIKFDNAHTKSIMARGRLLLELGDKDHALRDYTRAVETDPENLNNRWTLAKLQEKLGLLKSAIASYSAILQTNPDNTDAWLARSKAHNLVGQQQFALLDLNEAIRRLPDEDNALHYRRIHLLKLLERDEEVVTELEAIARKNPTDLSLRKEIVEKAELTRNHRAVVTASTEILRQEPDNVDAYRRSALANYRLNNVSDAIENLTTALKHDDNDIELHLMRARYLKENREYLELVRSCSSLLKKWPESAEGYTLRAHAERAMANNIAALHDAKMGLRYDPANKDAIAIRDAVESAAKKRLKTVRSRKRRTPRTNGAPVAKEKAVAVTTAPAISNALALNKEPRKFAKIR